MFNITFRKLFLQLQRRSLEISPTNVAVQTLPVADGKASPDPLRSVQFSSVLHVALARIEPTVDNTMMTRASPTQSDSIAAAPRTTLALALALASVACSCAAAAAAETDTNAGAGAATHLLSNPAKNMTHPVWVWPWCADLQTND